MLTQPWPDPESCRQLTFSLSLTRTGECGATTVVAAEIEQ